MAYNYDALYQSTPNALGAPTPAFVQFFDRLETQGLDVLDIGCGQGRDAVFVAQRGHQVVGMDMSPAGIADMEKVAKELALPIRGIVADVTDFAPDAAFDILLIDRTLHMLPKDLRGPVLARLLTYMRGAGWLLLADEKSNMPIFRDVLSRSGDAWSILRDGKGFLFARRVAGVEPG